jgi:hypothetical protein
MEIALVVAVMAALGFAIWLRAYAGGRLAGTPTEIGTFRFTLRAVDASTPPAFTEKAFELTVSVAPLEIYGAGLAAGPEFLRISMSWSPPLAWTTPPLMKSTSAF